MVTGASIQSLATSSLAISKMDGDMGNSCALTLMEKGMYKALRIRISISTRPPCLTAILVSMFHSRCVEVWDEGVLVSRELLDSTDNAVG